MRDTFLVSGALHREHPHLLGEMEAVDLCTITEDRREGLSFHTDMQCSTVWRTSRVLPNMSLYTIAVMMHCIHVVALSCGDWS